MKRLKEHLAQRLSKASAVLFATFALCALVIIASPVEENPDKVLWAIMFGVVACYFAAVFLVARARRTSNRSQDTFFGMLAPAMGYAAAVPASIAVPLIVIEAATPTMGPVAPLVAIASGMGAVLVLMLLARALELRIDPPSERGAPRAPVEPTMAQPVRIVEDLP